MDVSSSKPGKKREDLVETSDYQLVDVNSLSHERVREIGAEWLCQQAVEQLGLEHRLQSLGWERKVDRESLNILDRSLSLSSIRSRDSPVVTAKQWCR